MQQRTIATAERSIAEKSNKLVRIRLSYFRPIVSAITSQYVVN